jgi:hypothetical protein
VIKDHKISILAINIRVNQMRATCRILCLILLAGVSGLHSAAAQKVLYTTNGPLKDFSTVTVGDTILFRCDDRMTGNVQSAWISDSAIIQDKILQSVFAAINTDEGIYLYYMDGKKRTKEINAIVVDLENRTKHELDSSILISGNIIGTFVDNKELVFVVLDPGGFRLSIFAINKMNVVSKAEFDLPNGISDYMLDGTTVEMYVDQTEINSFKGKSKIKFYKYGNGFYLTIDRPFQYITELITLDPATKLVSIKTFNAPRHYDFNTYFFNEKFFRTLSHRNEIKVSVCDAKSGDTLAWKAFKQGEIISPIYFRYGKRNIIHDKAKSFTMLNEAGASHATMNVCEKDGKYIIQPGTFYDNQNQGLIVSPLDMVGVIASVVSNTVLQGMEGPAVSRYYYYEWDGLSKNMNLKGDAILTLKEKIDRYEIDQARKKVKCKYKSYTSYRKGIVATYYYSKTASLVYFE